MKQSIVAVTVAGLLGAGPAFAADYHLYLDESADNPGMSLWPAPGDIAWNFMDERPGDYFTFVYPLVTRAPNVHAERFKALDTDGDGVITTAEMDADTYRTLGTADHDLDDNVDIVEFSAFESGLHDTGSTSMINWPAPQPGTGVVPKVLDDRPGDYFVFAVPVVENPPNVHANRFRDLDANGDGMLSSVELRADPILGDRVADLNNDGQVDIVEFSALEANVIGTPDISANTNWPAPPVNAANPPAPEQYPGDYFQYQPPLVGPGADKIER